MTILEDCIKHDRCNTAVKKFNSEIIFKLIKSFVNDLHPYNYTGKQEGNKKEESVDGKES